MLQVTNLEKCTGQWRTDQELETCTGQWCCIDHKLEIYTGQCGVAQEPIAQVVQLVTSKPSDVGT